MQKVLQPGTPEELQELLAWAVGDGVPVELAGRGSKRDLGRPLQAEHRIDLGRLDGITLYEPEELVMSALPGTPLAAIEAKLAEHRQTLAFEPPDFAPLFGQAPETGSIGGSFLVNLSGPRRFKAGAARDHLLGLKAVSGRAEAFKTGGRVVKNVTGYDLCKLITGSFGTLAAVTELTFKVSPLPEAAASLLLLGLDDRTAVRLLGEAAASPHEVSGLAHLPQAVAARSRVPAVAGASGAVTAIRLEGPGPSVPARVAALQEQFRRHPQALLEAEPSAALWRDIRDVGCFAGPDRPVLWRISVPPADGPAVVQRIIDAGVTAPDWFYDWAGGLIWLLLGPDGGGEQGAADQVRGALRACGGHALLMRAPVALRAAVPVFQPQPPPLAALSERVKDSFDPRRVLNPGRMYAGV